MDPERTLALELVGMVALTTLNGLRKGAMPGPSAYVGGVIVYGMLSAAAMFGPGPAKVAAGLGGLALLAVLLAPQVSGSHVGTTGGDTFQTFGALTNAIGSAPSTTSPGIQS